MAKQGFVKFSRTNFARSTEAYCGELALPRVFGQHRGGKRRWLAEIHAPNVDQVSTSFGDWRWLEQRRDQRGAVTGSTAATFGQPFRMGRRVRPDVSAGLFGGGAALNQVSISRSISHNSR